MTKTAIAALPTEPGKGTCEKHGKPRKYSRKEKLWYCPDCLQASYLTWQAQQKAVRRYRDSNKGKTAQENYEKSEKGQAARQKYLKSAKYKQRRKEYNQRLKESLQIARMASATGPRVPRVVKALPAGLDPLIADILEYQELIGRSPSPADVKEWASDLYKRQITTAEATRLIKQAEDLPAK